MREITTDKYTVAWFKLAEFVARKEKERALGIYRLLSHSFSDQALAYQLEGDLLLSFNDDHALTKYRDAAEAYEKTQRIVEAIAVYEHIIAIKPAVEDIQKLLDLYGILGDSKKIQATQLIFVNHLICSHHEDLVIDALERFKNESNPLPSLYNAILLAMAQQNTELSSTRKNLVEYLINQLRDTQELYDAINGIQTCSNIYYTYIMAYLEKS